MGLRCVRNAAKGSMVGPSAMNGKDKCNYMFFIAVAPQIVPFVMGDEPANWGEAVTATCTVFKGDLPIDIDWSLNGQPISSNYPDITIASSKRVSLLTIDAVSARHAGEYTCAASNAAGGTSFSTSLAVNGTERTFSHYKVIYETKLYPFDPFSSNCIPNLTTTKFMSSLLYAK